MVLTYVGNACYILSVFSHLGNAIQICFLIMIFLGNYPLHFHMCHDTDGPEYPNPPYLRKNTINRSFARCVTIHGSHGVTVGLLLQSKRNRPWMNIRGKAEDRTWDKLEYLILYIPESLFAPPQPFWRCVAFNAIICKWKVSVRNFTFKQCLWRNYLNHMVRSRLLPCVFKALRLFQIDHKKYNSNFL